MRLMKLELVQAHVHDLFKAAEAFGCPETPERVHLRAEMLKVRDDREAWDELEDQYALASLKDEDEHTGDKQYQLGIDLATAALYIEAHNFDDAFELLEELWDKLVKYEPMADAFKQQLDAVDEALSAIEESDEG